jgi:trimethylamine--corrinoid protein Co-methyltransferase
MAPGLGLLDGYTLLYPEKLLLDDEIFRSIQYMAGGMHVDSETLALDEIMTVGPGGHFLDREYTLKNIRRLWNPGISQQWSADMQDFRDPGEAALEKTRWILQNHKPKPLAEEKAKELKRIIRSAERQLV